MKAPDAEGYRSADILDGLFYEFDKENHLIPGKRDEYFFPDQKNVYDNLDGQFFSYSGPTSMGKSFVVQTYIEQQIRDGSKKNFAILVPTKALINEVRSNMFESLQGLLEGSHEPIIDKDVFLRVQAEMVRRANRIGSGHRRVYSSKYALSSVVRCGHCGDIFCRIKWNNRGCRSTVWRCVSRVEKGGPACTARTIKEEDLHAAVITAINDIWSSRQGVIQTVRDNILAVIDSDTDEVVNDIDGRIQVKQQELLDAGRDQNKIDIIGEEILGLREERRAAMTEAARKKGIQERLQDLVAFLEAQPAAITEYSDTLVRRLIDTITVYDEKLVIEFKAGLKTEVEI